MQINVSWENAKTLEKGFGSIMTSAQSNEDNDAEIQNYMGQVSSSGEKIFDFLQQIVKGIEKYSS